MESAKQGLYAEEQAKKDRVVTLLLDLLAASMRLMHPFVSFITEEIYQKLPNVSDSLITSAYPVYQEDRAYPQEALLVSRIQEAVTLLRSVRSTLGISVDKKIRFAIKVDKDFIGSDFFLKEKDFIANFIGASELIIDTEDSLDVAGAFPVAGTGYEGFVFVREAIDLEKEIARLEKDREKNESSLDAVMKKLSNEKFLANAKEEAIEKEQGKKAEFDEKIEKGLKHIELLRSFL